MDGSGLAGAYLFWSEARGALGGFQQIAPLSNGPAAVSLCSNAICLKFGPRRQSQARESWDGSENCAFCRVGAPKALLARERERF